MSCNFDEAVMRKGRGFPASLRKILYNFLKGFFSSKSLGTASLTFAKDKPFNRYFPSFNLDANKS